MKSVAIIVPTIGSDHLEQCVQSIFNQKYGNITPYIVVDGEGNANKLCKWLDDPEFVHTVKYNVGANNFYGHRIYAAFSFLVNEDYVCFLDEDNWLELNHVEKMVENIEQNGLDWTHCLRNIYRKDGTFICQDNCESLGSLPTWISLHKKGLHEYHIDTSSFMVKREALVQVGGAWYGQWGADRQFFRALQAYFPNWGTTNNYSLNYRLDGNIGSVTEDFFLQGNKYIEGTKERPTVWKYQTK